MSRGVSFGPNGMVARSLKMTRATYAMVAAANAAITTNAMVAVQNTSFTGQIALFGILFVSMAVVALAVSSDVFSRSGQAVSNLRSIGASRSSLSIVVAVTVLIYGAAGAILGAALGGVIGAGLGGPSAGLGTAIDAVMVVAVSAAATGAGVFTGARVAWRS